MTDTKTFSLGAAMGFHQPRPGMYGEGDSIQTLYAHSPKELHPAIRWLVAHRGLYHEMRSLEVYLENPEEFKDFPYKDHVLASTVDVLCNHRVSGDLAYALGMVFHGTWDEVPAPYSTEAAHRHGYSSLIDCGILVLQDKDIYTMPEIWQRYLWLRGKFVWGDKPYDITDDYHINCGIYEYALGWCEQKPPRWNDYIKDQKL